MIFECPLFIQAHKQPDAPAIISRDTILTYADCHRLADSLAVPHDVVHFVPREDPLSILVFFACLRKKAIAFPISHRLPYNGPLYTPTLASHVPGAYSFEANDIATHMMTSGTTGTPKTIAHTVGNHFYSALGSNKALELTSDDRWKLSLPLFHVGGIAILFRCFLAGSAVTLTDDATHFSLVPTQLRRMLDTDPHGIRRILLGGDIIPESLYYAARNRGFPISLTYGMTEMSSQIATNLDTTTFSAGHPLPHRKLKIIDKEIYVGGKTLVPEHGEWFATGDLGAYDASGLTYLGRKDRMFISGGENIQPEEIEKHLLSLPGVIAARVAPRDDPEYGKVPIAHIKADRTYFIDDIKNELLGCLPAFKIPRALV